MPFTPDNSTPLLTLNETDVGVSASIATDLAETSNASYSGDLTSGFTVTELDGVFTVTYSADGQLFDYEVKFITPDKVIHRVADWNDIDSDGDVFSYIPESQSTKTIDITFTVEGLDASSLPVIESETYQIEIMADYSAGRLALLDKVI